MSRHPLYPEFVLRRADERRWRGVLRGVALWVDVSGFTALTEALSRHGPEGAELLGDALGSYFQPLVTAVHDAGGFVAHFAGDAFLSLHHGAAARAATDACALMRERIAERSAHRTRFGTFPMELRIGMARGAAAWDVFQLPGGELHSCFHGSAVTRAVEAATEDSRAPAGGRAELGARGSSLDLPHPRLALPELHTPRELLDFPAHGEFRDVTAMFLSFESIRELRRQVLPLAELVREQGGFLARVEAGDKGPHAVVFFDAPRATEGHVAGALEVAARWVRGRRRVGVARGIAYAGFSGAFDRYEFTCLGRATNIAARLMAAAAPGEAWCDAATERAAVDAFRFQPRGAAELKGIERPVALFALGPRKPPRATTELAREALFGRDPELARLVALFGRGEARTEARVALVTGEAGLGKTRLARALRVTMRRSFAELAWIDVRCDARHRGQLEPFIAALRLRSERADRTAARAAMRALRDAETGAPVQPEVGFERKLRILDAWLDAESVPGGVVLCVEDVHEADAGTRELVKRLAASGARGIDVLMTSREGPGSRDGESLLAALGIVVPGAVHLPLAPLPATAVEELARSALGGELSAELRDLVNGSCGGNPFFVEQLLGLLREQGALVATFLGYDVARRGSILPSDVLTLVTSRLERLGSRAREVVQTASILGREVDVELLGELLDAEPEDSCRLAEEAGIWERAGRGRYAFRHALLREAAYEMQPRRRLRMLHARAASVLEGRIAGREPQESELGDLAMHYDRAADVPKATEYLERVAGAAEESWHTAAAEAWYRRLLLYLPGAGRRRARAELGHARVLDLLSRWPEVVEACLRADRATGAATPESLYLRGGALRCMGHADEARALLESARQLVRERPDPRLAAAILRELGSLVSDLGDPAGAARLLDEALPIARDAGDQVGEAKLLHNLGAQAWALGDLDGARRLLEQSVHASRRLGLKRLEADSTVGLGTLHVERQQWPEAEARYEEGIALARAVGNQDGVAFALGCMASVHLGTGELARARHVLEESLAILRRLRSRRWEGWCLTCLGNVARKGGDVDAAARLYGEAWAVHEEMGSWDLEPLLLLAEVLLAQGERERAAACLRLPRLLEEGAPIRPVHRERLESLARQLGV